MLLWTLAFFTFQSTLSLELARTWDFNPLTWFELGLAWKLFTAVSIAWVILMVINLINWHWFRKERVDARLISRRFPNRPAKWPVPFDFLKHIGMENQLFDLEVAQYDLYLPGWPKAFSGLSLVQVSDIHFGKYIHQDYLRMVLTEAKKLKPDIFAFTGDFISHPKDIAPMGGLMKGFKAPLGVYALLGNHDHWNGGPAMRKVLEKDGVRVLKNEVVYLKRKGKTLALLGVDDLWMGEQNEEPLLEAKGDAKILLAHQPDHFYLAKKLKANLQISGHCHGGQIRFPLLGPLIIPAIAGRKFAEGFVKEEGTTLFIHRGIGCFPPYAPFAVPKS